MVSCLALVPIIILIRLGSVRSFLIESDNRRNVILFGHDRQDIQIFDNVFSPEKCKKLHQLAMDHSYRCECSAVSRFNSGRKTPLEKCLHQLLEELGDKTTPFIEYWARDEYINIDAHCDIDERELEDEGFLRYPHKSHILYLEISRNGPTFLFPNQRGAWSSQESSELITIPAVQGRLLVFDGDIMHAVPKPPHRYLFKKEEQELRDEEEELEFEEQKYEDDEEESDFEVERSVILFNTWSDRAPLDVLPDTSNTLIPAGIEIVGDFNVTENENDVDEKKLKCNPRISWIQKLTPQVEDDNSEKRSPVAISLMGKPSRRGFPDKYANLVGYKDKIMTAVRSDQEVSRISLW
eukprot:CAMPEP_0194253396 /NCGR_PEP_ID=MMETSP0158-20130606/29748_1 /TAXON_ID=33649 /ORGANISM="Thalassionema nitzschioides, Strain L26-B" /LENGTH=351 /DNA_ID=CAMNT_0038991073 /DNA_START=1 /DNA_END=1053 /DNA_ORIENTATION=+